MGSWQQNRLADSVSRIGGDCLTELGAAPRLHARAVRLVRVGLLAIGGGELDLRKGWG